MTTLDTLGSATPDVDEVADAALAMADFDGKRGDFAMALDWLDVAAQHRALGPEYRSKRTTWERASDPARDSSADAVLAPALTLIGRALDAVARRLRFVTRGGWRSRARR
jgi:hypothetical protein